MKKIMLLTSAAALALASCSNDEVKDVNRGRAIDFRTETAARATETTDANLESFYASAYDGAGVYDNFDNEEFVKNAGYFISKTSHYWPETGELSFVAYAPAQTENGGVLNGDLTLSKGGLKLVGFAPRYALEKQCDFVHAVATGSKALNEKNGVNLNFNHALSQVEIKAKNMGNKTFTIAGVKIVGVYNGGDYTMGTGWATTGKNKGSYKVTYDTPVVLNDAPDEVSIMGETGTAMLVPQTTTAWVNTDETNAAGGSYIAVKLNLKDENGKTVFPKDTDEDAYGWVAVPVAFNWEPGKKYIYTLDFATGAGYVAPASGGENKFDPGKPGDENDKDHPLNDEDESNDNGDEDEQNPGGDGGEEEEAPNPGDTVLETPIRFTVTVSAWTATSETPKMEI